MSLDGLEDLDIWEWSWEKTQESATEKKEKAAKAAKAMAWIQKTRKDEKRAQKDNDFLYQIVTDIIKIKQFDVFIPVLSEMLSKSIPSNLIIWWISLVYDEAVYIIRNNYIPWNTSIVINKEKIKEFKTNIWYTPTKEIIEFNDNTIDTNIKERINEWIEDIISVVSFDPSNIVTNKFLNLIKEQEINILVTNYFAWVFSYFLLWLNIVISKEKAFLYSKFLLWEIIKKMKYLQIDEDLI